MLATSAGLTSRALLWSATNPLGVSSAGETDALHASSLDETLPLGDPSDSLAAERAEHDSERTGEEHAFGDASDARFHPSPLRILSSNQARNDTGRRQEDGNLDPSTASSPPEITGAEFVWDQGTLSRDRFEARRVSSAIMPEESLNYEAGAARPTTSSGRAAQPERPSADLSPIAPVTMASASS